MKYVLYFILALIAYFLGMHRGYIMCSNNQEPTAAFTTLQAAEFREILDPEDPDTIIEIPVIKLDKLTRIYKGNVIIIRGDNIEDTLVLTESLILETVSE